MNPHESWTRWKAKHCGGHSALPRTFHGSSVELASLTRLSTAAVSLMKHIDVDPPRRPRVAIRHDPRDVWSPYPRHVEPVPGHHNCVFDRWCDLSCITIEISRAFHNVEDRPPQFSITHVVHDIYRQLQSWYASLPECLNADNATVPHILSIQ